MSEETQKINVAAVKHLALKLRPGVQLMPSLLVVMSSDVFDESKWRTHTLAMPSLDEDQEALLDLIAYEYAQYVQCLVAVVLADGHSMAGMTLDRQAVFGVQEHRILTNFMRAYDLFRTQADAR